MASLSAGFYSRADADESIKFNTDVLDVNDLGNISLDQFSHARYSMPGDYTFSVRVNRQAPDSEHNITYYPDTEDKNNSLVCVPKEVVHEFGLKEKYFNQLTWLAVPEDPPGNHQN